MHIYMYIHLSRINKPSTQPGSTISMEVFSSPIKAVHFCSSLSRPINKCSSKSSHPIQIQQLCFPLFNQRSPVGLNQRPPAVINCCKASPETEVEKQPEEEEELVEISEEDVWVGNGGRWREKCDGKGIVQLMECLEKEAIMGEDEGRDPTDYHRRAHIFDKSSRVFQSLKENKPPSRS